MMVTDPFRSALPVHDPHEAGSGSWAGLIDGAVLIDFGRWRNSDAQPVAPPQLEPAPAVHPKQ
jgi:hypothetical protein